MGGAIPYENGREVGSGAQKKGNKSPVVKAATELEMIIHNRIHSFCLALSMPTRGSDGWMASPTQ